MISLQFIDKTDSPAFLAQIDHDTSAFSRDSPHRSVKLISAVTFGGTEYIARQTFGMNSHQHRLAIAEISHSQGHMMFSVQPVHITVDFKVSILRRHVCLYDMLHNRPAVFLSAVSLRGLLRHLFYHDSGLA